MIFQKFRKSYSKKKIIRNHMTSDDNPYQILFLNMTDYLNMKKYLLSHTRLYNENMKNNK